MSGEHFRTDRFEGNRKTGAGRQEPVTNDR